MSENVTGSLQANGLCSVEGHVWGELDTSFALSKAHRFTRILAADCLWMPYEHANLLKSMSHFLSVDAEARARALVIAGFHTGRSTVASFFQEALPATDLAVESIWECNIDGQRRSWDPAGPEEDGGERKKWLVVAILKQGSDG